MLHMWSDIIAVSENKDSLFSLTNSALSYGLKICHLKC